MKNISLYLLGYSLFLLSFFTQTQAQTINDHQHNLRLKKMDTKGSEMPFTVKDAINLVRFFMTQEEVHKCESDLDNNTLRVISRKGHSLNNLLEKPLVFEQISAMGYHIELGHDSPFPKKEDANPIVLYKDEEIDCNGCGKVELSKKAKENLLKNNKYNTDLIFDMGSDNGPSINSAPPTPTISEEERQQLMKELEERMKAKEEKESTPNQ